MADVPITNSGFGASFYRQGTILKGPQGSSGKDGAQGPAGPVGAPGPGPTTSQLNEAASIALALNPAPKGDKGDQGVRGPAATVSIGAVTKGAVPAVINSGTPTEALLDFIIPGGDVTSPQLETATTEAKDRANHTGVQPIETVAGLPGSLDKLNSRALVAGIVGDYNSITGTGTDDGPAIRSALQALAASGGGTLVIPYTKRPFIGTSFTMPANTSIRFDHCPTGTHDGLALPSFSGTLWLSSAATIKMGNGCQLHTNVFRAGLKFGITAAQVATSFAGTAILLAANAANIVVRGMVVGFEYSIEPEDPANTDGTKQSNRIDLQVVVDCKNGPHIHNSYDIGRHNSVHCWPFVTVTSPAEAEGAQLKRPGYALWLSGVNDWTMVFQHFSYGYAVGCRLTNCASVTVVNGGHDHVPGSADGSIGYLIEGNAREITLVAPQAAGKQYGIVVNSTTGTGRLACEIVAPRVWVTTTIALDIQGGSVKVTGGTLRNDPVAPKGIGVKNRNTGSAEVMLLGVDFCGLATAIENQASTSILRHHFCTFRNVAVQITNAYMPSLASAGSLVLNGTDFVFTVTGTSNVGNISSPQRYAGRGPVTFICVSGFQFLFGGNIITRSGANTPVPAGRAFTAVSDGANWYEV